MTSLDPVIETRQLGKRFGRKWAVRGLDLFVPRGAVYGFLGLNGAGKTTTLRMLLNLLAPTEGSVRVLGLDPQRSEVEVKRRVGYVPDTPCFYEWMTPREMFAFIAHHRRGAWDDARATALADGFDIPADQRLDSLSKGQRAKVNLVAAMAFSPDLLLLDEPTLGLDPLARRQFVEGVLAEYMDAGRTVFISSHLISEIAGMVDHVGIMQDGALVTAEPVETLLARVKRVRLLYDDAPPAGLRCGGLLRAQSDGREALLVLERFDPQRTPAELAALGARSVTVEDVSLEDAFIELAGRTTEADDATR